MEYTSAVAELKKKLLEAPVLGYPNDRDQYTLTADASLTGIGAILTQKQGTEDRVIAYASKTLSKSQQNYSATKRELFAICFIFCKSAWYLFKIQGLKFNF